MANHLSGEDFKKRMEEGKRKKFELVYQKSDAEIAEKLKQEKELEQKTEEQKIDEIYEKRKKEKAIQAVKDAIKKAGRKQKHLAEEQQRKENHVKNLLASTGVIQWENKGKNIEGYVDGQHIFSVKPGLLSYNLYVVDKILSEKLEKSYISCSSVFVNLKNKAEQILKEN